MRLVFMKMYFSLLQNKVNNYSAVARIFLKGYPFYNQLKDKGYDKFDQTDILLMFRRVMVLSNLRCSKISLDCSE